MTYQVWLVGPDGESIGWVDRQDAEALAARHEELDLVKGERVWTLVRRG